MKRLLLLFACLMAFTSIAYAYGVDKKTQGYDGFVVGGNTRGVGDFGATADRIETSKTHGYEFNQYSYIGGGVGVNYFYNF